MSATKTGFYPRMNAKGREGDQLFFAPFAFFADEQSYFPSSRSDPSDHVSSMRLASRTSLTSGSPSASRRQPFINRRPDRSRVRRDRLVEVRHLLPARDHRRVDLIPDADRLRRGPQRVGAEPLGRRQLGAALHAAGSTSASTTPRCVASTISAPCACSTGRGKPRTRSSLSDRLGGVARQVDQDLVLQERPRRQVVLPRGGVAPGGQLAQDGQVARLERAGALHAQVLRVGVEAVLRRVAQRVALLLRPAACPFASSRRPSSARTAGRYRTSSAA